MALLLLSSVAAHADITPVQAERFLLFNPPQPIKDPAKVKYAAVEKLVGPMFSTDLSMRYGRGYTHFLNLKNMADQGNPYAAYNVALYMLINREKFKFDYMQTLLYLKQAKDGDIADAKYSLALIYQNQFTEVARMINPLASEQDKPSQKHQLTVQEDGKRLQHLSQQYILELSAMGHNKAYLSACNLYATGIYLPKDAVRAAMCYDNAIRVFDSMPAKSMLVQLYFSDPAFDSPVFEKRGVELAQKAVRLGDTRMMAILGRQLIYPKYLDYADVEAGSALIQSAAAQGDELAQRYLREYFDGSGRLLIRPSKPVQNWHTF